MKHQRFWRSVALGVAAMAMFGTGVSLACSGNYCGTFDTMQCVVLDETVDDTCCVRYGTGRRCATCTREQFLCDEGGILVCKLGAAYNCRNYGATCQ